MIKRPTTGGDDAAPQSFPEVTPRQVQHGHDFQLQIIMELQRSVGELSSEVRRLSADMKSTGDKVDKLRIGFAWAAGAIAVVGFLVAGAFALLRFMPDSWLPK